VLKQGEGGRYSRSNICFEGEAAKRGEAGSCTVAECVGKCKSRKGMKEIMREGDRYGALISCVSTCLLSRTAFVQAAYFCTALRH
jgi:hypothetical protein